jgi:hypothetical protein
VPELLDTYIAPREEMEILSAPATNFAPSGVETMALQRIVGSDERDHVAPEFFEM